MDRHSLFAATAAAAFFCFLLLPVLPLPLPSLQVPETAGASAAEPYSYGGSKGGKYGERREITTRDEAEALLRDQYSKQDVRIGAITEKERYFEAEILDARKGAVIDTVIIDKRTGRIRSIY
ncbi:MAG: hypothetical protein OHK006_00470 [Thermodesulfovibrionales bacterium]